MPLKRFCFIFFAVLPLLSSCSDLRDRPLHELEDGELKEELSAAEFELVQGYMMRQVGDAFRDGMAAAFSGAEMKPPQIDSTMTIREILEAEKKARHDDSVRVVQEQKAAAEAEARRKAEIARLRQTVILTPLSKGFVDEDIYKGRFDAYVTLRVALKNDSNKEISGVKGTIQVMDKFEDEVIQLSYKYDKKIPAGERVTEMGYYEYNQFIDSHQAFRGLDLESMKIEWIPEMILFSDGTKLELSASDS